MATILPFPIRTPHDMESIINRGRYLIHHNGWGWRMVLARVVQAEIVRQREQEAERKRRQLEWKGWP